MKRLFEVNGEYFADKKAAKAARGEPTKQAEGKQPAEYKFAIRPGPDHWLRGGPVPGFEADDAPVAKPVKRTRKKAAEAA